MQGSNRGECLRVFAGTVEQSPLHETPRNRKAEVVLPKMQKKIDKVVYDYSIGRFSRPLCVNCQKYHHRLYVKGDNTFKGKGFYCNKCKRTITFKTYRQSMHVFSSPLCKDCQEGQ